MTGLFRLAWAPVSLAWCALVAAAPPPEIRSVEPAALRPGTAAVLVINGKNLADARTLWTSWSSPFERWDAGGWQATDETLRVPVFVPANHPCGVEMIRVAGANGLSNPLLLLVDGLPAQAGAKNNNSLESAQPITAPQAIDDNCAASRMEFYRLALSAGQHVAIEVVAHRLGWNTDPVLRVLDDAGRELAYVNDSPGLGSDCALDFRAPAAGDYFLEVRDAEYGGGRDYRFRLRVGAFPVAALPIVPCVQGEGDMEIAWESTVSGRSGKGTVERGTVTNTRTARWRITTDAGEYALTPRLPVIEQAPAWEEEPNDAADSAFKVSPDVAAYGRFGRTEDMDWFRVEVPEPGPWRFEVRSRSIGLPCDPILALMDAQGTQIATTAGELDPILHHRFDAAGTWFLRLHEAGERFGSGRAYVLSAQRDAGGFEVSSEEDRIQVAPGDSGKLKVTVERRGYDGPITFEAVGLTSGFAIDKAEIAAGRKDGEISIRCDASVQPGTWCRLRLAARRDGATASALINLRPAMRKAFPKLLSLPAGFDEDIWVCAVPRATAEDTPKDESE